MLRLFVSLYLLLILSIGAINWLSERIWQQFDETPSTQIVAIEQLANTLALTLTPDNLEQLSNQLQLNITTQNKFDIALLSWQEQQLTNGKAVIIIGDDDELYTYVQPKDQLYLVGPFYYEKPSIVAKQLIFLFSYLCLALIIALWIWPLWRDLKQLQHASSRFSQGATITPIKVHRRSNIAPLLATFNAMTTQISRLIDEQKQLSNAVSHEIRTPLSRLKFAFAMLDDKAVTQLPSMRQDVDELESLVDEMLNYGRLESQNDNIKMEDVNISELAQHLIEKLTRHQTIDVSLNILPNIIWRCDGHLIERALQNYITNGLRYAKSKLAITIDVRHNNLVFNVEDDGPGIAKEQRQLVFNAFTRLDKSRNKNNGGFGLGLAIVKRIAHWHQGHCDISESKWQGAKFSLIIPPALP